MHCLKRHLMSVRGIHIITHWQARISLLPNFTLQNKVEVKTRGRKGTSNRIDGFPIIALHYRMTSEDWKLGYINKPHFKV